ncbi:MAG: type I DNA topoisomerase [Candidatus Asgardarchaeia archaeon]
MSKYLVIVESPKKTGYIKKYLGKDYDVIASMGHVADLPKKKLSVDLKNDFKPTYAINSDKQDTIKKIKDKAKKAEIVYLMSDLDREGEAIAWHISRYIPKGTTIKRAVTGSITKSAVQEAIKNAGDLDMDMVASYECRRILDRLCGYKASFPTKQATGGPSAGRVQSAALRILAEREKEIRDFVPQEYWPIEVELERNNGERVIANIKVPKPLEIKTEKQANDIVDVLKKEKWIVSKYETKEKSTRAYPPFTTSTLYQSASSILGWGSKKTAQVAQSLYEQGSITYIRSDSTYIVPDFVQAMRCLIPTKYGDKYLSSKKNVFANKSTAQEAHEAIRVTDIAEESVSGGDNAKLYKIVWKRTVASQMANLIQFVGTAEFECEKYIFGANGSKVIFDGWKKVWNYGSFSTSVLPEFVVGEELKLINVKTEQKFTSPSPRYSESSLTKELEKRGIGRPSTYASIPTTLFKRGYIEKKKNIIYTTEMGIRVSDFLVGANFCFVDLGFTSNLETQLDCISRGDCCKVDVLQEFWDRLKEDIKRSKEKKEENSKTDFKCPQCGANLLKKYSKWGEFLSCSNRSNKTIKCDYKCDISKDGEPKEKPKIEIEESNFVCPNCDEPLIKKKSKKNWEYLGCRNWRKDDCRGFYDKDTGEEIVFKKKKFKKWKKK